MKAAIVYSSHTGNTKQLADAIYGELGSDTVSYIGPVTEKIPTEDFIFAGFWTDKGSCDQKMENFLKSLQHKKVFLFGTAGFGGDEHYFQNILSHVSEYLGSTNQLVGSYMCQGKMPMSIRNRYEKLLSNPDCPPNIPMMIENFDRALSHPDQKDLEQLREKIKYDFFNQTSD